MSARRITRALAVAGVAILALTACGGGDSAGSSGEIEGNITYSFWGTPARADKVNTVIDQFHSKNPGTKVTAEVADYNSYIERLTVRAAGGGLACALGTQSTFYTPYAKKNVLEPLDELISSGAIDTKNIPADVVEAGKIDGKQYMIPTGTFVRLLAYNEDLIKKSGAELPTDDLTWEQYGDWLRKVQAGLPNGVKAAEIEATNMFSFTSWVVGHGETMFEDGKLAFDKKLLADWYQFWLDLTADGVTIDPAKIPDQSGPLELTPLATGQTATATRDIPHLFITAKALQGSKKGNVVGHVSIPSQDPARSANILGSNGISIPAKCDNKATAAAFINHFANDVDAALAFQSDNGVVTNTAAQDALLSDPKTPDGVKQNVTILRELTESGDLTNTTYPEGLATLTNELNRNYQQVAFGKMSVEDAVNAFFSSADEALS